MKRHNFKKSYVHGKNGEETVKKWFVAQKSVERYEDVSENPAFQKLDIDGIVWLTDGTHRTVEIKTDSYTTGNMFYETQSCVEMNTIGCMERCNAKYLYYYFTALKSMYVFHMDAFRQWALAEHEANPRVLKDKLLENDSRNETTVHHSAGFIIPLTYLEQHFPTKFWKKFDMTNWQNTAA